MTQSDNDKTVISVEAGGAVPSTGGIPRARLICLDTSQVEGTPKEMVIPLIDGQQTVGRSEECTFPIPSRRLSRQHARVFSGPNGWCVEDLNSTNGVHVDGLKVTSAWLTHGQEVRFGPVPFRFEIDQGAPVALPVAETDAEDEERTMMVGSAGASRAVLEAARTVDPIEPPPPPTKPVVGPKRAAASPVVSARESKSRLPLIVTLCVLLGAGVGGGWVVYPRWERQKTIEELRKTEDRLSRDLIAVNQYGLTPKARDSQDDEAKRSAEIEGKRRALEDFRRDAVFRLSSDREYWPLATSIARAQFLLFESRFADALRRGDFAVAGGLIADLSAGVAGLEKVVPSDGEAKEIDALRGVRDLARLATLVVNYRRFAAAHPQVTKDPASRPTSAEVAELVKSQADFAALARSPGMALTMQINYHLFFRAVKEADERDIILINSWKEALAGGN